MHNSSFFKRNFLLKWLFNLSAVSSLLIITTLVSFVAIVLWILYPQTIIYFALQPAHIFSGRYIWTLVTHLFVHGGPFHLLVNMIVLISLGTLCERIIGRKRFIWFYVLSGVFAGLLALIAAQLFGSGNFRAIFGSPDEYMVGASGAIFAIAGLLMMLLPRLRFSIIFLPFFSLPAYVMVPLVLILTWVISVLAGWNVGNVAHAGGFIVGAAYGFYLRVRYRRKVLLLERYFK